MNTPTGKQLTTTLLGIGMMVTMAGASYHYYQRHEREQNRIAEMKATAEREAITLQRLRQEDFDRRKKALDMDIFLLKDKVMFPTSTTNYDENVKEGNRLKAKAKELHDQYPDLWK